MFAEDTANEITVHTHTHTREEWFMIHVSLSCASKLFLTPVLTMLIHCQSSTVGSIRWHVRNEHNGSSERDGLKPRLVRREPNGEECASCRLTYHRGITPAGSRRRFLQFEPIRETLGILVFVWHLFFCVSEAVLAEGNYLVLPLKYIWISAIDPLCVLTSCAWATAGNHRNLNVVSCQFLCMMLLFQIDWEGDAIFNGGEFGGNGGDRLLCGWSCSYGHTHIVYFI